MKTKNLSSAASNNAQLVERTKAELRSIACFNAGGAAAYVKLYDKAVAPTIGTDVPVLVVPVPAAGSARIDFGSAGMRFILGMGIGMVTGAADTDNTAVAAAQLKVTLLYGG